MRKKMMAAAATMVMSVAMAMVSLAAVGYVKEGEGWKYYFKDGTVESIQDTGWIQEQNGWRFLAEGDPSNTGTSIINGKLYCFSDDGYMRTGWVYGGFDSKNPATGERQNFQVGQQEWYYFLPDGSGATGWQLIEGKWYYFKEDSIMLRGDWTPDGFFVNFEDGSYDPEIEKEVNASNAFWEAENAKTQEERVQEVIDLTNEEREKRGLAPLVRNESLMEAAAVRAEELAEKFSHIRPNGTSCSSLLSEYGISNRSGAENITQMGNAAGAVYAWMKSTGHKKNILNSEYTEIGVGYNEETNSWVQIFIGN